MNRLSRMLVGPGGLFAPARLRRLARDERGFLGFIGNAIKTIAKGAVSVAGSVLGVKPTGVTIQTQAVTPAPSSPVRVEAPSVSAAQAVKMLPSWVVPAAIAVAALILFLLLRRK